MTNYLHNHFNFDELPDHFDELPFWSAPFGLQLLNRIKYRTGITALDIGFGTGFPLTEIAMRLGHTSQVYGIDPWSAAIARVRKKMAYYGISNVQLIEGVAESIPLENDSIDLITSNNGINNVQDIDRVLAECARIARPGAQFIQTMNTGLSMFEFYHVLETVFRERHLEAFIAGIHEHIAHKRPPVDIMLDKIRANGFLISEVGHDQFNYFFSDGTAMLNHYFIRLAFMESWAALAPPDQVAGIFEDVEYRLNEQARVLGGLRLSVPFVVIDALRV